MTYLITFKTHSEPGWHIGRWESVDNDADPMRFLWWRPIRWWHPLDVAVFVIDRLRVRGQF